MSAEQALWIDLSEPGGEERFDILVEERRDTEQDVGEVVRGIISDVRDRGDQALIDYTKRFDRFDPELAGLRLSANDLESALEDCKAESLAALDLAAERIRAFHQRQMPQNLAHRDELGVEMGMRWQGIDAVGLYVPGGTAAYPSSVLMNAIPAKVAGCRRLVMVAPTPDGIVSPLVLAAALKAGVDEVYKIGGAQAIAALAYGTKTIAPVDKVVGPGNAYVAEAKRQVFGRIGIDMIAGPSEIVVIADQSANPVWIAADLLSQAEHDERAQAILITDSKDIALATIDEIEAQLARLPRNAIARKSWRDEGSIVLAPADRFAEVADRLAPEHLELMVADAEALAKNIRRAGAIFIGHYTPEVLGDYLGGPNHVLPTNRSARFSSGLSVFDFLTRSTYLSCPQQAFETLGPAAVTLAREEGLEAHARAAAYRLGLNE